MWSINRGCSGHFIVFHFSVVCFNLALLCCFVDCTRFEHRAVLFTRVSNWKWKELGVALFSPGLAACTVW